MDFTIREAREDDAPSMVELLNAIIDAGGYTIMEGPVTVEEQIAYIRSFPARGLFNVAVASDKRVIGMQSVERTSETKALRHVGEISTFVALDLRGKGIGRSLSKGTSGAAKERGFTKVMASIRADNPSAIAFYQGQGFRIIGIAERHAFVDGRYVDEVVAERLLG